MATQETVQLNEAHAPQQASIDAFNSILDSVKEELVKLRRDHDSNFTKSQRVVETYPTY